MLFKPQAGEEREAVARGVESSLSASSGHHHGEGGENNVLSHHTALCSNVLEILAKVGRAPNVELSDETWEHLLKVTLGKTFSYHFHYLCFIALRCVAVCCVALCCAVLRCVVLCCVVLRCVGFSCVGLCCAVLRCAVLRFVA